MKATNMIAHARAFAEQIDERVWRFWWPPRLGHHLSEHRAQSDDDGDEAQNTADSVLECLDRGTERHSGRYPIQASRDRR